MMKIGGVDWQHSSFKHTSKHTWCFQKSNYNNIQLADFLNIHCLKWKYRGSIYSINVSEMASAVYYAFFIAGDAAGAVCSQER